MMLIPLGPKICSNFADVFNTAKITITLQITATIIFSISNSARSDNKVVKLPGPAINGKANGKTEAVMALLSSLPC